MRLHPSSIARKLEIFRGQPRLTYSEVRDKFVSNESASGVTREQRREIVQRFEVIDKRIPIKSTPTDGLFIAEALLSCRAPGDVVECGCYSGGSTAKISIVCQLLGKRLYVFDSFEGLPGDDADQMRDLSARLDRPKRWKGGAYAGSKEQVASNVTRYGAGEVCTYIPGWFKNSLTVKNLPPTVSLAFTDVDLPASAKECLRALWPLLTRGAVFFSHDVAFVRVLQELYDPAMWRDELHDSPPVLFGAGFGLTELSPHLGFFVKGHDLTPEELKQVMLFK